MRRAFVASGRVSALTLSQKFAHFKFSPCALGFNPSHSSKALSQHSLRSFFSQNFQQTNSQENASNLKQIMSVGKLNHVALAVTELEQSVNFYKNVLGAKVSDPVDLPEHGVTTVFVELENTKFELLKPLGDNSPIANFLQKNKNGGIHHVCLEVANIDAAVQQMKNNGVRCLNEKPKIGAHGKPVVFLHPKDCFGVLIELEQV